MKILKISLDEMNESMFNNAEHISLNITVPDEPTPR